jgi:ABC-type amino acid transport substrate-binding protein
MRLPLIAVFLLGLNSICSAADPEVLRVGIHEKPPYSTKDESGEWTGIGVELWKDIATQAQLRFEWVEMAPEAILPAVRDGILDLAIGEMQVTSDNERAVNFTQPYLQSSIGVALAPGTWASDWRAVSRDFFNWTLVTVLLSIFVGMLIVSTLIWWIERNHHVGHFKGGLTGFGSALWFSAVTMTTVGYGDKTPSTLPGRIISFIWMFAGVLLIAGFTAAVASSVSTARLEQTVRGPADLLRLSCGVTEGSISQQFLRQHGVAAKPFDSVEEALEELGQRKIEAVVADRIMLSFLVRKMASRRNPVRLNLTPAVLKEDFIAIPVRPDLAAFKTINVTLLEVTASPGWQRVLNHWLGAHR